MINLTKIQNGFTMNNVNYTLSGDAEIFNDHQVNIPTNNGVLFFDISVSINNQYFENIQKFVDALYN